MRDPDDSKTIDIEDHEALAAADRDFILEKQRRDLMQAAEANRVMNANPDDLDAPSKLYRQRLIAIAERSQQQADRGQAAHMERLVDAKSKAQVQFSEQIGQMRAFDFMRKVGWIATLKIIAEMRDAKAYKGLSLSAPTGDVTTVQTWDEFCAVFGVSRRKIEEDLLTLDTLGAEFMETARAMKLGHRDIQKLRKLPEDDRAVVIGNVEVAVGDKTAIVELIDELAGKHAREKAALEERLEKAEKRVDAVVAEETKALTKERDALVQERDTLADLIKEPAWDRCRDHARLMGEMLGNVTRQLDKFLRAMPKDQAPPEMLALELDAYVFQAFAAAETAQARWLNAKARMEGEGEGEGEGEED